MKKYQEYIDSVHYLESFLVPSTSSRNQIKPNPEISLKRTGYFLHLLGNPHHGFKFIHITGTAGKGSTANFVQHILSNNGIRTGLFTSPFCTTSIEKVKVDDLLIAPEEFVDIVNYLKPYINQASSHGPYGSMSYFELFFVIATLYFKRAKCEWVVLEVGLGGSFDSTNIITNPKICAITNIGYDHTKILGKTLTKIARDKAGIIKRNCVFITTEKRPGLIKIFKQVAQLVGVDQFTRIKGGNEELAMAIAKAAGAIDLSIKDAPKLPCRSEIMQDSPVVILDGAHNPSKIDYAIKQLNNYHHDKVVAIVAISADKEYEKIINAISLVTDKIIFTRFLVSQRVCVAPEELLRVYNNLKPKGDGVVVQDPYLALDVALRRVSSEDLVFITGSFYLTGELRKYWHPEKVILESRNI